jgi:predicted DNA-binding transcriptional regulator AlpA
MLNNPSVAAAVLFLVAPALPQGSARMLTDKQQQRSTTTRVAKKKIEEENREQQAARLLSKRQVLARVCVTYPSIWKWMREGKFPRSRVIGGKIVWLESEINDFINGLPIRRLKGDEEVA